MRYTFFATPGPYPRLALIVGRLTVALRRQMSSQFVRVERPKEARKTSTCEVGSPRSNRKKFHVSIA
jgi:hypothetical protein